MTTIEFIEARMDELRDQLADTDINAVGTEAYNAIKGELDEYTWKLGLAKASAEHKTHFEVVHLNEQDKPSGWFATVKVATLGEARENVQQQRTMTSPTASAEDRAYWARQNYAIFEVVTVRTKVENHIAKEAKLPDGRKA